METRWGKRFDRYEVVAELGRGAMGVVYKARDPKIDRFVAVKTISLSNQDPAEQREYRERFFHEAQAAGRLLHPGIVTIFDTGEDSENRTAYIVMEYVEGQSLDRLLSGKKKKLRLDIALTLTGELAEALDHAHGQGVVHRDMKPANILVTKEGHAKIADFGIAKMNLSYQTIPGRAIGTPAYMSPEQLEGEPVDRRSDLFSLGAILYRMVTGYGPFQGNSATTVCFKVSNRDPLRATSLDSDLPSELDAIISRAMAKDPAQRYQRGLDFALDLRELRERGRAPSSVSGTRIARADNASARAVGDAITEGSGIIRGFFGVAANAAKKVFVSVHLHVLSKRQRLLRMGLVFTILTVVLVIGANLKTSMSRRSRPTSPLVTNEAAPEVPQQSAPDVGVTKVSKAVADSTLDVCIDHHFSAAQLSLWIDDKLAYDRPLHGQIKKRWNPFRGTMRETETVRVASGKHRIRVRVRSLPDKYEQSAAILGSFATDHSATLQISFQSRGKVMRLAMQ